MGDSNNICGPALVFAFDGRVGEQNRSINDERAVTRAHLPRGEVFGENLYDVLLTFNYSWCLEMDHELRAAGGSQSVMLVCPIAIAHSFKFRNDGFVTLHLVVARLDFDFGILRAAFNPVQLVLDPRSVDPEGVQLSFMFCQVLESASTESSEQLGNILLVSEIGEKNGSGGVGLHLRKRQQVMRVITSWHLHLHLHLVLDVIYHWLLSFLIIISH